MTRLTRSSGLEGIKAVFFECRVIKDKGMALKDVAKRGNII